MTSDQLTDNLAAVEAEIAAACARAGRPRADVTLVAVTKAVSADVVLRLAALGVRDFGESRPQALWDKAGQFPTASWHMIGHLQRNKVERTAELATLVHSADSLRLLDALEAAAAKRQQPLRALIELHLTDEATKGGLPPADLPAVAAAGRYQWLRVCGLMAMAPLDADPESARPTFRRLRELRDEFRPRFAAPHDLAALSMGMSNDFAVAVEEGATLVRVGSRLFEGVI